MALRGIYERGPHRHSYLAIGYYGVPAEHLSRLGWTEPSDGVHDPMQQGTAKSWGGSGFEQLLPTLFAPYGESYLADQHTAHVDAQIAYGQAHLHGHWGVSVCEAPDGEYQEQGIPGLGMRDGVGYDSDGIVTPHVLFLSLAYRPEAAKRELTQLQMEFPEMCQPGYGFTDSVAEGNVSKRVLVLDKTMEYLATYSYLTNGGLWRNIFPLQETNSAGSRADHPVNNPA